jgi:hypothetical protein
MMARPVGVDDVDPKWVASVFGSLTTALWAIVLLSGDQTAAASVSCLQLRDGGGIRGERPVKALYRRWSRDFAAGRLIPSEDAASEGARHRDLVLVPPS